MRGYDLKQLPEKYYFSLEIMLGLKALISSIFANSIELLWCVNASTKFRNCNHNRDIQLKRKRNNYVTANFFLYKFRVINSFITCVLIDHWL